MLKKNISLKFLKNFIDSQALQEMLSRRDRSPYHRLQTRARFPPSWPLPSWRPHQEQQLLPEPLPRQALRTWTGPATTIQYTIH